MSVKDVPIRICTEYGESGRTEYIFAKGPCYCRGDSVFVRWKEERDGLKTTVRIRYGNGRMEVERTGDICSLMVLDPGRRTRMNYRTPFGTVFYEVDTLEVFAFEEETRNTFHALYTLYDDGQPLEETALDIIVQTDGIADPLVFPEDWEVFGVHAADAAIQEVSLITE